MSKFRKAFIMWLARKVTQVTHGVKYKKVHIEVKSCSSKKPHENHQWMSAGGYMSHGYPFYCEGVN